MSTEYPPAMILQSPLNGKAYVFVRASCEGEDPCNYVAVALEDIQSAPHRLASQEAREMWANG